MPLSIMISLDRRRRWLELAALFNPKAFREFFATFKAKKMGNDASWVTVESPI